MFSVGLWVTLVYLHEYGISFWNTFEHVSTNMLHTYVMENEVQLYL